MYNVKFHSNYTSDQDMYNRIVSMTPKHSGIWKNLQVVSDDDYDLFVIMNYPQHNNYDPKKTIVFESETPTTRNQFPRFYQNNREDFLYVHDTINHFNVDLWYHGLSYDELTSDIFNKTKSFSVINSNINNLPGHIYRNTFVNELSKTIPFDLFGRFPSNNNFYKGSLGRKCDGLLNYKYTFNCENDFENNYFTEKILDGIFCETVTFYVGCPNIKNYIDERSYIQLSLNSDENIEIIKDCLSKDVWVDMIPHIKEEKLRIMNDYNVLNIVNSILEEM